MDSETLSESTNNLPSGNQDDNIQQPEVQDDKVAYGTYKRTVGQVKSLKQTNQELVAELERLKSERQAEEEKKLEEDGNLRKLAELRQAEADRLKQENAELSKTLVAGTKYQAFVDALPGRLMHRDYLQLANVDDIVIDPDTGRVDSDSVKEVVDQFVKEHPSLVENKSAPRLPSGAPRPPEKKTISQMNKSERSDLLKKALAAQLEQDRAFKEF